MSVQSLAKAIQRVTPWRAQRTCKKLWQRVRPFERRYRLEAPQFGQFTVAYRGNTVDERVLAQTALAKT
jgi:hypothetical protein